MPPPPFLPPTLMRSFATSYSFSALVALLLLVLASSSYTAAQALDVRVFDPQTGEPIPAGLEAPPAGRPASEPLGGGDLMLRQYLPSGSTKLVRDISDATTDGQLPAIVYQDGGSLISVFPFALSDPNDCPCFSEPFVLDAQPADAVVERTLLYVALRKSKGLLILDISDLFEIQEVGRIEGRDLLAVAVDGNYAYAGAGTSGIVVYDVSDPANPTEVGTASAPGSSNGAFVSGTTLYVATGVDGLRTFDLTDPTNPAPLGHFDTGGEFATYVAVRDTVAWLTGAFGLIAVDVRDPAAPTEVGRVGTNGETTYEVAFDGDTAYLPGLDGLRTLDVSDPAAITEQDLFPASQAASVDVYAFENTPPAVYLAERFKGLHMLDGGASPQELLFFENAGFSHKPFFDGDLLYVTDLAGRLRILATSGDEAFEIARIGVPPNTQEVFVEGDLAYVTDADGGGIGLTILDVSDPTDPQIVGGYSSANQAFGLDVIAEGGAVTVYLANGFSGLVVLDASDPANVVELGSFPIGANAFDVEIRDDVAHLVSFGAGMLTLDVSDPQNITQLDAEPSWGFLNAIDLGRPATAGDEYGYVADGGTGQNGFLRIVNIKDPSDITTVRLSPTLSQARDVVATTQLLSDAGKFPLMYVADDFVGLREFTGGPGSLEETGSFESGDRGIGVATNRTERYEPDDALVALAAGEAGVYLFELPPNVPIVSENGAAADTFSLAAPFPNPVRDAATFRFTLPNAADVTFAVYDVLGRRVATLADGPMAAGAHEATFDATGLPNGVYLGRLTAGAQQATQRVVVVH